MTQIFTNTGSTKVEISTCHPHFSPVRAFYPNERQASWWKASVLKSSKKGLTRSGSRAIPAVQGRAPDSTNRIDEKNAAADLRLFDATA